MAERIFLATNHLTNSPHYKKILKKYSELYSQNGKVNGSKFFNEEIKPLLPDYSLNSWLRFIARFKVSPERMRSLMRTIKDDSEGTQIIEKDLEEKMLTSATATQLALQKALNIGLERLAELKEDPTKLSFKDAIDLIFKAMKAQDSRARVIKEIREDNREEEKFNRMLNEDIYNE